MTNTYEPLIDWLVARCGGSKHISKRYGPELQMRRKKQWRWTVTGHRAAIVLANVVDEMMVKRNAALALLERSNPRERRYAGPLEKVIREMEADGWPPRRPK